MSDSLTDFYDKLKTDLSEDRPKPNTNLMSVSGRGPGQMAPGAIAWRNQAIKERDKLKEDCSKRIILDIYCNILPLDKEYIDGNQGQMKADVDAFIDNKGTTAVNYLKSSYEKTHAPMLEFVIRAVDTIGAQFMKEADETLKDAQQNNIQIPPPKADINSKETESQLVDVTNDAEVDDFMRVLREKTIKKIVNDISKVINDKQEEKKMTFNSNPTGAAMGESTISVSMDYINQKLWKENVQMGSDMEEEMIGLAIRESTLNQLDVVFAQPYGEFKQFSSRIRFGKGVLINESAVNYFREAGEIIQARYEPIYKEDNGNKYDIANHEKISSSGQKSPMTDDDAKKYLDPAGYKAYQNKNESAQVDEFIESVDGMINQYIESCLADYNANIAYYSEAEAAEAGVPVASGSEAAAKSKNGGIVNAIKNLIKKIKDFIMRILDPLIRKIKGATKAKDKQAIINALASVNINPAKKANKIDEKVDSFMYEERGGKHYFVGPAIIDLYYYKDTVLPQLKEGKVPSMFKIAKNIIGSAKVGKIAVEDYKNLAIEILDTLLVIEKKITAMTDLSEKRKGEVLNKILLISNKTNMFLTAVADSLKSVLDPLTEEALIQLSDINKIERFLDELRKESPNNASLMKDCLTKICMARGWKSGAGTARFYIPDPGDSKYGYKFALSVKGISDNQRELDIWRKVQGTEVAKYLIPIDSVSQSGLMVKVAAATDIGTITGPALKSFAIEVDKASKGMEFTGDVLPKLFGFLRIEAISNPTNVGKYNGHPVIIDYANSQYKFSKK